MKKWRSFAALGVLVALLAFVAGQPQATAQGADGEGIDLKLFTFNITDLQVINTEDGVAIRYTWHFNAPPGAFPSEQSSLQLKLLGLNVIEGEEANPPRIIKTDSSISTTLSGRDFLIAEAKSEIGRGFCDEDFFSQNEAFLILVKIESSGGVLDNQSVSIPTQTFTVEMVRNGETDCQSSLETSTPLLIQKGSFETIGREADFAFDVDDVKLELITARFGTTIITVGFFGFKLSLKPLKPGVVLTSVELDFTATGVNAEGQSQEFPFQPFGWSSINDRDLIQAEDGTLHEASERYALNSRNYINTFSGCSTGLFQDETRRPSLKVTVDNIEAIVISQTPEGPAYRLLFPSPLTLEPDWEIVGSCG